MSWLPLRAAVRAVALPLALVAAWHWASLQGASWAYAFVPLGDIWRAFVELLGGELMLHLSASLATALIGLAAGSAAGLLLGTAMALARVARVRGSRPQSSPRMPRRK